MLTRPRHLARRQIVGKTFSESCTIIRTAGTRDPDNANRWVDTETRTNTVCVSTPMLRDNTRSRLIRREGIQLAAARLLWTVEDLNPKTDSSSGDFVEYAGDKYRVMLTERWGGFSESVMLRVESEPMQSNIAGNIETGAPIVAGELTVT